LSYRAGIYTIPNLVNSRFITHSGQETARLNRNQSILASYDFSRHDPDANYALSSFIQRAASLATWTAVQTYRSRLDDIFVDEVVYTDQWRMFIDSAMQDWREAIIWGVAPLLSGVVSLAFLKIESLDRTLASLATVSSLIGILSGSLLCLHHSRPAFQGAAASMGVVVDYLDALFFKPTDGWHIPFLSRNGRRFFRLPALGFLPLGAVFAAPKASIMWAFALLLAQSTLFMARTIGPVVLIGITFILVCAIRIWRWLVLASAPNGGKPYEQDVTPDDHNDNGMQNKETATTTAIVDIRPGSEEHELTLLLHRGFPSMGHTQTCDVNNANTRDQSGMEQTSASDSVYPP
jgi:hypothetical protein